MHGGSALRAVVDTNVWVSGYLHPGGAPGRILRAVRDGRVLALATAALAEEIVEVLERPRLLRLGVGPESAAEALWLLRILPEEDAAVPPIRNPSDEPVLASAFAGRAAFIVSGDDDLAGDASLVALLAETGIAVVRPAAFLRLLP
ncbi:MAG: putative toxin-antitoxin system toxin component, PIN family [Planctomycetes bacterium]|nr:putative toxin-antitoxin system toxin component, PIN family [Planctomycetota bacterium]